MMKRDRYMALMSAVMVTLSLFGAQRTVEVGSACKLVDPFWGCGGTASAPSEGMARGWNWEKAQTGNTHPGAVRPFGWVSACAYTGGYSSGYGRYGVSGGGTPPEKLKTMQGFGFTHFHNNGAGWIWHFLNMFLFTPHADGANLSAASAIVDEKATPGYYAATLSDYGAAFELTADRFAACHRYRFMRGKGRLRVDLTQLGFRGDIFGGRKGYKETVEKPEIRATGDGAWTGSIRVYGIRLHFGLIAKGGVTSSSVKGGVLEIGFSGSTAETAIGFSDECAELAVQRTQAAAARGFDRVRADAAAAWESLLGTVRPAFAKESDARRFYSTLYQSTTKPSEFREGRFTEFQTLWDMYRTQVPLALALCPAYARRILESMLATSEQIGYFPVAYLFQRKNSHNLGEASVLGAYSVADGCFLGLLGKDDYPRVKAFFLREFGDVKLDGKSVTHRLDLAGALRAAAWVAEANGDAAQAKEWLERSAIWKTAYNPTNGYLQVGNHYEGTEKNYSFRPHVGMKERIALAGGVTRFETMMDDFFAINGDFSKWTPARDRVSRKGKFEGLNNESDMNAPCTWLWCGRLDRLAEVHDLIRRCRFADGEGGCPGNNDGGGTSSWYVWSCLGLYPLSGTPYCLLVSPTVESAEIPFGTGRLSIAVTRESAKSIYPVGFTFNGRSFKEPWLPLKDLTKGGLLEFRLADRPQGKSPVPDWL